MVTTKVALFEGMKVRKTYENHQWWFSVVDIIAVLTESSKPRVYWSAMKNRVKSEDGLELSTICRQLKLTSSDGKKYQTDCANTEAILRIIQSIPSPKAEPLKLWLAKVGYERIEEINDPEKALNRSRQYWQKMGHSQKWIQQRMMGQEIRNKLTDYWQNHEVTKQQEYAILTNIIHQEWSDLTVKQHKKLKKLEKENLRDHMTDAELVFTALAELSSRQIAETKNSTGLNENRISAHEGGTVAKHARKELEQKTGKKIISPQNYKSPKSIT